MASVNLSFAILAATAITRFYKNTKLHRHKTINIYRKFSANIKLGGGYHIAFKIKYQGDRNEQFSKVATMFKYQKFTVQYARVASNARIRFEL